MKLYSHRKILEYWNRDNVESMYDKNLLKAEIGLIKKRIPTGAKILDAGCGEGKGTLEYSKIRGVKIHAADFSETRLKKAKARLKNRKNVMLKQVNFLKNYGLDNDYDIIISQRFLINFKGWKIQQKVLTDLMKRLKIGAKLIMLEGSKQGADSLNKVRMAWKLKLLPIKWHNLFLDDLKLLKFMRKMGYELVERDGLGTYFLLTRGIRPALDNDLSWDCKFNKVASERKLVELLGFTDRFSRLKLWVFQK
jgi:ubiquinone/menaquinone biosynthesis C-methylase UbiE